jgi:ABC-type uncharacterized transport system permease subunit
MKAGILVVFLLVFIHPAAAVQEIPTLDMATGKQLSDGITDPWYQILGALTTLIVFMIIVEIAKKMGFKVKK